MHATPTPPPARWGPEPPSRTNAALVILLVVSTLSTVQGYDAELCVVQTPLKSPYFVPYVEVPSSCLSCVFTNAFSMVTPPVARIHGDEEIIVSSVHVIQVRKPLVGSFELKLQLDQGQKANTTTIISRGTHHPSNESINDVINPKKWIAVILAAENPDAPPISFIVLRGSALLPLNVPVLLLRRPVDDVEVADSPHSPRGRAPARADGGVVVEVLNGTEGPVEAAKRLFGFVSSHTRTLDATKLNLKVPMPDAGESPRKSLHTPDCSGGVTQPSSVAQCSGLVRKQTSGCYHENLIGTTEKDIHIVEVDMTSSASNDNGSESPRASVSLLVSGVDSSPSPPLKGVPEEGGLGAETPVDRNLTLVLRSNRPTAWTLQVSRLRGSVTLLVGRGDQVENKSSSLQGGISSVAVSVQRQELPPSFDQMILRVLTSIGPPISYTKTRAPAVIVIGVAPPAEPWKLRPEYPDEKKSHPQPLVAALTWPGDLRVPRNQWAVPSGTSIPGRATQDGEVTGEAPVPRESSHTLISDYVTRECGAVGVRVSLPLWVAERLGGVSMTLQDPTCHQNKNATHVFIASRYVDCGFVHEVSAKTNIYTNFAHIQVGEAVGRMTSGITDDEDFEGSGFGLEDASPVHIPTVLLRCKMDSDNGLDSTFPHGGHSATPLKYNLEVYRDQQFSLPYLRFPATLETDEVHARLSFANGPVTHLTDLDLRLMIERCWLSLSSGEKEVELIHKSCPVDTSVYINRNHVHDDLRFSFQVSGHFVENEEIYLQCLVGVCSQNALPKPSFRKCVDPKSYCRKHSLVDVFAKQAVVSRPVNIFIGPFIVRADKEAMSRVGVGVGVDAETMMTSHLDETEMDLSPGDPHGTYERAGGLSPPVVVLEGLSTEAVVGIAVAAFAIGVCLTATLWLIYTKTDPRRQKRPPESHLPRNSGYDLSAHSGSSTPSSQAPMTA